MYAYILIRMSFTHDQAVTVIWPEVLDPSSGFSLYYCLQIVHSLIAPEENEAPGMRISDCRFVSHY